MSLLEEHGTCLSITLSLEEQGFSSNRNYPSSITLEIASMLFATAHSCADNAESGT